MVTLKRKTLLALSACLLAFISIQGCDRKDDTKASAQTSNHNLTAAKSYFGQNQYRAAIIEVRNALQANPTNEAAQLYAQVFIAAGQPKIASDFIEQFGPNSRELSTLLVRAYLDQKKYVSAKRALANFNSEALPLKELGMIKAELAAGLDDLDTAQKELKKVINAHPNYEPAHILKLKVATINNDSQMAAEAIDALNVGKSQSPETFITLAQIAASKKDYNKAELHLMNSLRYLPSADILTPQKSTTLLLLIETLTNQGRYSDAVPYSQLLAKTNPDWQKTKEQMQSAIADLQKGNIDSAENVFLEMQKNNTNTAQASAMLGLINLQRGDVNKAAVLFENNIDPETAPAVFTTAAAITLLQTNEYDEAISLLEKALEINPKETKILTLYGLALSNNTQRHKEGIKALIKAVELSQNDSKAYVALAEGYYNGGEKLLGKTALLKAFEIDPSDTNINFHIAKQLAKANQKDAALDFVKNLASTQKNSAQNWFIKGYIESQFNEPEQARKSFEKALKIDPKHFDSHFYRALLASKNKKWQVAQQYYRSAIAIDPTATQAYGGLLNSVIQGKSESAGISALSQLASEQSTKLYANLVLANYFQSKGKNEKAQKAFAKIDFVNAKEGEPRIALQVESVYINIATNKIRAHVIKGEKSEALKTLESALMHYPMNVPLLRFAASTYIKLDRLAQAASIASKLKQQNQDNFSTLIEVEILTAQEDYEPALALLKNQWNKQPAVNIGQLILVISNTANKPVDVNFIATWKEKIPTSEAPYFYQADQYIKANNYSAAIKEYESVLSFQPNNIQALNNAAWLSFEQGEMNKALLYADSVYKLAPANPQVLDTVGWIKANAKDPAAITILEKALKLAPDNADINNHLKKARILLSKP